MSSLNLIKTEYDSDSDENCDVEVIKSPKLPAPNLSKVLTVNTEEVYEDSPSLHEGRIRTFPYVRGNWATSVYIKYPHEEDLNNIITKLLLFMKNLGYSVNHCNDLHVSLSRTFVLKYHQINSFSDSLLKELESVDCFELAFHSIKVYCNEEKTRTFVALQADYFSHKELLKVTKNIDKILEEYRLPTFYEEPSFHMSVLWLQGDTQAQLTEEIENYNHSEIRNTLRPLIVKKVFCKTGNKNFQYYLR